MIKDTKSSINFKEKLVLFSFISFDEVLRKLKTDFDTGLNDDDIIYCHDRYGFNEIETTKKDDWYKKLYESFVNPFNMVLFIIIGISFLTDYYLADAGEKDLTSVIVISVMVFMSGILDFIQDAKSNKASEKLKAMITTTTKVLRNNETIEIPLKEVVPGDIIYLSAGSIIPADLRILRAKNLFVSQSALTGESSPVEKYVEDICWLKNKNTSISPLELNNLCFMGTNVVSGSGIGVVLVIGKETYFGSIAQSISHKKIETNFDKGIKDIGWMLIKFVLIMAITVFLINGFFKGDWISSFLFAVSIAIGLTPEMLPVIVTTNLAKGALVMSKKKTIVKNLSAIQNFGAMDILCTDKTGTLTEDKIILEYHLNIKGEEDETVFKYAYLNSYYQTGLKNLLDLAVLKHIEEKDNDFARSYDLVNEIPFDFIRKRMSVVLRDKNNKNDFTLITKGAVEEMLEISKFVEYFNKIELLTTEIKQDILNRMANLNNQGMRVIGVAYKKDSFITTENLSIEFEKDMIFTGFIAFLDPPKESAIKAIQELKKYGVKVKLLTGDNELVAKYICKKVGIGNCNILLGSDLEYMTNLQLKKVVDDIDIFAKLTPQQKGRVVSSLRENGHVVGFMGDGINDASAMKKSDVAISVDTAVDIAKESADIILLEKNLEVLINGVIEGRKIFGNIVKYIKMTTSSNFGNMLSILVACAFLPFLPMLPLQILVLNLFYDISQIVIPWDNMDEDYLQKQKKWDIKSIQRFMLWLGSTSSIFDLAMFFILYFIFGFNNSNNPQDVAMFQTGWFVLSLITQTIIIHFVRTEKIPFIQSIASKPVIIMTTLLILISLIIPYTALGTYIKMAELPFNYYIWLVILMLSYILVMTIVKKIYRVKYKDWL